MTLKDQGRYLMLHPSCSLNLSTCGVYLQSTEYCLLVFLDSTQGIQCSLSAGVAICSTIPLFD